ncbi:MULTISPECIES: hypothetical protein [Streptosporangium]|uniref:PD-(D/E)XK endonuclease-like domain-containing protein n=1 Tax=Streptosporangium brasiliense TaxID=47480 RepID=A0ABT9RM71_9ACTN|nr:hypothetical protein [Streptosporangium brasiliense]MDP9870399.1 hypothetical protein [Streptosporangium brasiliense]
MLTLYFGGSEIPGWRKLLAEQDVTDVGLSFVGLSRRTKFARPWLISDKYPDGQRVFLDSGAYTVNSKPDSYSREDIETLSDRYQAFVLANLDRVEMVSELDARAMGPDWIERQRSDFYGDLGEKFLPIWDAAAGLPELERLADSYGRVGVPQTSISGRDIAGVLNRIARRGVRLHGIAMTKPDLMESIAWDSVASTSWLSPAQYGDSQIWTGHTLKRYPKAYKAQGRKRHRAHLDREGFDTDLFEGDDSTEVLKVAVWSWRQLVGHLNSRKKTLTMSPEPVTDVNGETTPAVVGMDTPEARTKTTTAVARDESERELLPGLSLRQVSRSELGENGEQISRTDNLPSIAGTSLRQCNSCYIASHCKAFRPDAGCAYEVPITLRTREQIDAADDAIRAIRFQRIAFMHMVEQMEGGYADPNLTKELDGWDRSIAKHRESESETLSISVKASSRAQAQSGMIARLFGKDASESARALAAPVQSDHVFADAGIVEAEVIGD